MSRANVERLRPVFEAFPRTQKLLRRGELELSMLADDVVWDASELDLPDQAGGVFHGREGARRFWMDWLAAWDEVRIEFELVDAGEHVLVLIDQWMRSSQGVDLPAGRYAQVWTFDADGLVVRWKSYFDEAEARRAVGLD